MSGVLVDGVGFDCVWVCCFVILFVVSGVCGLSGFGLMVGLWLLLLSLSVWLVDAGFMLGDCTVVLDCCFVCFVVLRGFLRFANFMLMVVRFCDCLFGWLCLVAGYACWQGLWGPHNLVVWLLVWVFALVGFVWYVWALLLCLGLAGVVAWV